MKSDKLGRRSELVGVPQEPRCKKIGTAFPSTAFCMFVVVQTSCENVYTIEDCL